MEAVSQCPVQYGRASNLGKSVAMLEHFKTNSIRIEKTDNMSSEELDGKYVVGEFVDLDRIELSEEWARIKRQASEADL